MTNVVAQPCLFEPWEVSKLTLLLHRQVTLLERVDLCTAFCWKLI